MNIRLFLDEDVISYSLPQALPGIQGASHAGILLIQQQQYSTGDCLRGLMRLITSRSAEEMVDQLNYLFKILTRIEIP